MKVTLKQLRQWSGMSQTALSRAMARIGKGSGYQNTIQNIESGKAISIQSVKFYLNSLGYTLLMKAIKDQVEVELDVESLDGTNIPQLREKK